MDPIIVGLIIGVILFMILVKTDALRHLASWLREVSSKLERKSAELEKKSEELRKESNRDQ